MCSSFLDRWHRTGTRGNLNPRTFKFLHITWSFHDARYIGAEIVMNCTVSGVGTTFLQKSLRSGLLWPRRADNLNPRTFKFLHTTWSFQDAQHIGAEIVMNCTVSGVGTTFLQKSLGSGLLWQRRADNLYPRAFKFLHIT